MEIARLVYPSDNGPLFSRATRIVFQPHSPVDPYDVVALDTLFRPESLCFHEGLEDPMFTDPHGVLMAVLFGLFDTTSLKHFSFHSTFERSGRPTFYKGISNLLFLDGDQLGLVRGSGYHVTKDETASTMIGIRGIVVPHNSEVSAVRDICVET